MMLARKAAISRTPARPQLRYRMCPEFCGRLASSVEAARFDALPTV
ncbi:MAG: hypothetical protein QOJ99_2228 [Bryobacterales bacterium]|jgi:hypothetical protein|nr:hypothetical protein [Bryobacterales bacterium]